MPESNETTTELAVFGGGCFWCLEAAYKRVPGIISVKSGYCGGDTKDPDYRSVCSGTTGHAEVVAITFDPAQISFNELLNYFFAMHDPTQLNRQGNDIGTQYRSVVFPQNAQQKQLTEAQITTLEDSHHWADPIVTTIETYEVFYPAETYHDDYFDNNQHQPYCQMVVAPKVEKIEALVRANARE